MGRIDSAEADRRHLIQACRMVCRAAMWDGLIRRHAMPERGQGCSDADLMASVPWYSDQQLLGWRGFGPRHLALLRDRFGSHRPDLPRPEPIPALRPDSV